MCLYPKLIRNKKYTENKKNGGKIPICKDKRTLLVPIACQKCMECRKQKARGWQVRILEDIKKHTNGTMVTLTLSEEELTKLTRDINPFTEGYNIDNEIITLAVERFQDRWRKKHKEWIRHWLVTELGHKRTERIHVHGIIWTDQPKSEIAKIWQYGYVWLGSYVNESTANYIVKYVNKVDQKHPNYISKILASKGIGSNYTESTRAIENKFKEGGKTNEAYRTSTGHKMGMPIYWRNKIYNENEREDLWLERLDKEERYINGYKVSTAQGLDHYMSVLAEARRKNAQLGYGSDKVNWDQKEYEQKLRTLKKEQRIENSKKEDTSRKNKSKNSKNTRQCLKNIDKETKLNEVCKELGIDRNNIKEI